jgi:hypothetical protein
MKFIKNIIAGMAPRVKGKFILFLSDDWGGVRLSSIAAQKILEESNQITLENRFDKYDMLESNNDMEGLFDVLLKHKDDSGRHPTITAMCNVANPQFEKIRESEFEDYFFEPFTQTLGRYSESDKVYQYYLDGIKNNIFVPEFHGREHLQIDWWLKNLQRKNFNTSFAFEQKYFYLSADKIDYPQKYGLGAAFNIWEVSELKQQKEIIKSGLQIFRDLMGYSAQLFTPPGLIMNQSLEPTLVKQGIKFIDKPIWEKMPEGKGRIKHKFHFTGQKSKSGIKYLVRNAVFEPNINQDEDGVDSCLAQISNAFKYNIPAIISNHRAAFVGGIDPKNRDKGLRSLDTLFKRIIRKWPEVEFVNFSDFDRLLSDERH